MKLAPLTLSALSGLCLATLMPAAGAAARDQLPWPWAITVGSEVNAPAALSVVPRIREVIVSVTEDTKGPALDLAVNGETNTAGWTEVDLVPVFYPAAHVAWPTDGVYDFVLYAREPAGMAAQVLTKVSAEARFPLSNLDAVGGVRIYGTEDCIYVGVMKKDEALAHGCKMLK